MNYTSHTTWVSLGKPPYLFSHIKQHDATGSLTRFSTRQVPDVGDFPETLGVVSNCTTYTFLQQVTERKYDSCPCRQMNPAATPTFSHVYLPLQSQQSTGRKLPSLRLKTFMYRVFRQTPRVGHVDFKNLNSNLGPIQTVLPKLILLDY